MWAVGKPSFLSSSKSHDWDVNHSLKQLSRSYQESLLSLISVQIYSSQAFLFSAGRWRQLITWLTFSLCEHVSAGACTVLERTQAAFYDYKNEYLWTRIAIYWENNWNKKLWNWKYLRRNTAYISMILHWAANKIASRQRILSAADTQEVLPIAYWDWIKYRTKHRLWHVIFNCWSRSRIGSRIQ